MPRVWTSRLNGITLRLRWRYGQFLSGRLKICSSGLRKYQGWEQHLAADPILYMHAIHPSYVMMLRVIRRFALRTDLHDQKSRTYAASLPFLWHYPNQVQLRVYSYLMPWFCSHRSLTPGPLESIAVKLWIDHAYVTLFKARLVQRKLKSCGVGWDEEAYKFRSRTKN
jgi:hypothetical protein